MFFFLNPFILSSNVLALNSLLFVLYKLGGFEYLQEESKVSGCY